MLSAKPCLALSVWDIPTRTGTIFVLLRSDYTKATLKKLHTSAKADQKDSVVHELVHNVVGNMKNEYAVVTLTHALKP
jgi:hypothetical protein